MTQYDILYDIIDIFGGDKLVNYKPLAKIFLANIYRYTENVFGLCTDFSLIANFFLANSFYLYGSPCQYFPCMVVGILLN